MSKNLGQWFGKWEPREAQLAASATEWPVEARSFTLSLVADQRLWQFDAQHPRGFKCIALHEGRLNISVGYAEIHCCFIADLIPHGIDAQNVEYGAAVDVRSTTHIGPLCISCHRDSRPWNGKEARDLRPKLPVEQREGVHYRGARVSIAACRCQFPLDAMAPLMALESLLYILGKTEGETLLAFCGNGVDVDTKTRATIRDLREFIVTMMPVASGTTRMA